VLIGFKAGTGLFIASGQLGKVLGVSITSGDFADAGLLTVAGRILRSRADDRTAGRSR